jgi:general L-amino acid transport system permease protein
MATVTATQSNHSPRVGWRPARWVSSPAQLAATVVTLLIAATALVPIVRWAIVDATWSGTAAHCRAGRGACWAFIAHKLPFIVFGLYPPTERWRAAMATLVLLALVVATASPVRWRRWLVIAWIVGVTIVVWLLHGGFGLTTIPTGEWGGLPVTLLLTVLGLALGFPLAIVLALGRRSRYPVSRALAGAVVEGVRGVPLIAVLYVAVLVFPLALPAGVEPEKLPLALGAVALFAAAYLGEAVRAGLQMVPRVRSEAALALGLRRWQAMRLVILPEALRIVVPSFVSIAVGFFQDTSLIVIIGLFDLLNTARLAAQDPEWLGFHTEAYVFVGLVYFLGSAGLSRYGLWLERRLGRR